MSAYNRGRGCDLIKKVMEELTEEIIVLKSKK